MRRSFRCIATAAIATSVVACQDPVTAPRSLPLSDQIPAPPSSGSTASVVFLPPLGRGPLPRGSSDVSHRVAVQVCVRADTACVGDPIATLDSSGTGASRLAILGTPRAREEGRATYAGEWRVPLVTREGTRRYRVTVVVDGQPVAHRDLVAFDLLRDLLHGMPAHWRR